LAFGQWRCANAGVGPASIPQANEAAATAVAVEHRARALSARNDAVRNGDTIG